MSGWEAARTRGCGQLMRTTLEMGVWPQTPAPHAPAHPTPSASTPGRDTSVSVIMASMGMSAQMCVISTLAATTPPASMTSTHLRAIAASVHPMHSQVCVGRKQVVGYTIKNLILQNAKLSSI